MTGVLGSILPPRHARVTGAKGDRAGTGCDLAGPGSPDRIRTSASHGTQSGGAKRSRAFYGVS